MADSKKEKPEEDAVFCAMDAKACADGSFVGRDPHNNCKFKACPNEASKPKPKD